MTPLLVDRNRGRRHEVAAAILAAFASDAGVDDLRRLVDATPSSDAAAPRLRAGLTAARAYRRVPIAGTRLGASLAESACLLRAGLFFEVHERLEVEWRALVGPPRVAVQGLIQTVVALHHFAHGNVRGAVSLMAKGRARLARHGDTIPEVDVPTFLAAMPAWERALQAGPWPDALPLPALILTGVSFARARPPSG